MNNQRIASELLQVARLLTAVIPSGDCFKFATKEAKRNDLAEERDIDLSKVKFKVRSSSDMVAVEMLYGGKRIGGMNAHNVRYPEEQACPTDVTALAKRFPELIKGEWERSDGEVWRSITALAVFKAFITTEEFRGLGLGKRMYKTLMRAWFKKVGPFLFMPYKCDGGSGTSTDAMRVWHSLSKEFPSSGDVVAVMKNPHVARELTASASGFMAEYRASSYPAAEKMKHSLEDMVTSVDYHRDMQSDWRYDRDPYDLKKVGKEFYQNSTSLTIWLSLPPRLRQWRC